VTDELFEERLRRDLHRLAGRLELGDHRPAGRHGLSGGHRSPLLLRGRRRARRRGLTAFVLAAVAGVVLLGPGRLLGPGHLFGPASPSRPFRPDPTAAAADAPGFPGALAYLSRGSLYTAEPGSVPTAVTPSPSPGSAPQWSASGTWVGELGGTGRLRVLRASGAAVALPSPATADPVTAFEWSPAAPLLALIPSAGADAGDLVVVDPAAPDAAPMVVAGPVVSFLWSPDGHRLAVVRDAGPGGEQVDVVDVVTGSRVPLPYRAPPDTTVLLGSWWPDGAGLLFWLDPGGSTAAEATGLPLVSLALGATDARTLGRTFVYLPWLAWSPDGHRLLIVDMSGAFPWDGSHLAVCRPGPVAPPCRALPQPAGAVTVDPAWAPDGRLIAFVRAGRDPGLVPGTAIAQWYGSRRLWVASPDGQGAEEVHGTGPGVADPVFGPSSHSISYAGASDIATIAVSGGRPTVIAAGLSGALDTAGPDGFGKLPWGGLPSWGPLS
jgi:TolB protein